MLPTGLGLQLGLKGRGLVEKEYEQMKREEISKVFQGPCSIIQLAWKRDGAVRETLAHSWSRPAMQETANGPTLRLQVSKGPLTFRPGPECP